MSQILQTVHIMIFSHAKISLHYSTFMDSWMYICCYARDIGDVHMVIWKILLFFLGSNWMVKWLAQRSNKMLLFKYTTGKDCPLLQMLQIQTIASWLPALAVRGFHFRTVAKGKGAVDFFGNYTITHHNKVLPL